MSIARKPALVAGVAALLLAPLVFTGCASSAATDFPTPEEERAAALAELNVTEADVKQLEFDFSSETETASTPLLIPSVAAGGPRVVEVKVKAAPGFEPRLLAPEGAVDVVREGPRSYIDQAMDLFAGERTFLLAVRNPGLHTPITAVQVPEATDDADATRSIECSPDAIDTVNHAIQLASMPSIQVLNAQQGAPHCALLELSADEPKLILAPVDDDAWGSISMVATPDASATTRSVLLNVSAGHTAAIAEVNASVLTLDYWAQPKGEV